MARMDSIYTLKRDNELVNILFEHKGKQNAIETKKIAEVLSNKGYNTKSDTVHCIVRKIIVERHLPICSVSHCGYYWATSREDIQSAIDSLQDKMQGLQERIDLLKSFIIE